MMKHALLAGAMTIAAPALAQTATIQPQPQSGQAQTPAASATTVPDQAAPAAQPMDSTTPAEQAAQAQPAPGAEASATATTAAQPSSTQPASGAMQVASIVDTEFPSYDANKDGQLTRTEFDDWMVKLKQASDPATAADAPATKKWLGAAFTQADKDRNKAISKAELIGFLSKGQS